MISEAQLNKIQIGDWRNDTSRLSLLSITQSQSSPDVLWPNMKWTEVTQSYAGLFFRAEGGNSSSYGQLQLASAPHLAQVQSTCEWQLL